MSNVTLLIGGRTYRLSCAEGEEEHIAALGKTIDEKLAAAPGMASQSEAHTLLYAALFMADELHEARRNGGGAAPAARQIAPIAAEPLEKLAERLESLAIRLEQDRPNA